MHPSAHLAAHLIIPLLDFVVHDFQASREVGLQAEFFAEEGTCFLEALDVSYDVPRRVLCSLQSPSDYVHHHFVQPSVKVRSAGGICLVVPALVPSVTVQVPTQFYQQFECQRGSAGQGRKLFDGGDEGAEGGGEGAGGEVLGEGVLEAVEIVVEDGHFAVEVVVEGLGGRGVGVHGGGDRGWNVC